MKKEMNLKLYDLRLLFHLIGKIINNKVQKINKINLLIVMFLQQKN